ncbi:MAG: hypothetical protein IJX97_06440 [Clostridia bacterium]|nr:hypothetical protein [Clostridia bacterium]
MNYVEIDIKSIDFASLETEIMYEIATARVDGAELLRFNLPLSSVEKKQLPIKKYLQRTYKILKELKLKGMIQFFATSHEFRYSLTEAVFLINKYPELVSLKISTDDESYIFVKL